MPKMATRDDPGFEARQFRLELTRALLAGEMPNPARSGCPGDRALREFAENPGPLRETADLIAHTMQCSPCFQELTRYREQMATGRRRWMWVPVGAAAAVVMGVGTWFLSSRPVVPPPEPGPPPAVVRDMTPAPPQPPPSVAEPQAIAAVLNLEGLSPVRGEPQSARPIPRLPRRVLDLSIRLPLGSEPGRYEVRLGREQIERQVTSTAVLRNGVTTVRVRLDLRSLSPGVFNLAIRRNGQSWHLFRIGLE